MLLLIFFKYESSINILQFNVCVFVFVFCHDVFLVISGKVDVLWIAAGGSSYFNQILPTCRNSHLESE